MYRVLFLLLAAIALAAIPLQADVIVNTSIVLNTLSVTSSSGTVQFAPMPISASAQAQDSFGGSSSQYNLATGAPTSATANTVAANASSSMSAPLFTGSATSGVSIPNTSASASSSGISYLGFSADALGNVYFGSFQVNGAGGSVNVMLSAGLTVNQTLTTTAAGQSAYSEGIFTLLLPDLSSSPELFYDNPVTIGPNTAMSSPYSNTLTNSLMIAENTPYTFILTLDAESSGVNAAVPEPSLFVLTAIGLAALVLARKRSH